MNMIIKIDINDNDYAEKIFNILNKKVNGLWGICDKYFDDKLDELYDLNDKESLMEYKDISIQRDDIKDWIFNNNIPSEEKENAINIIKQSVLYLIKNSFSNDSLKYLEDVIKISFPKSMNAQWENGEAIFYSPNTYSINKFLLF